MVTCQDTPPQRFLPSPTFENSSTEDFKGYLQSDGYIGYDAVGKREDIIHVGCLAHARRKFDEAVKTQSKTGRGGLAKQGLALINKIYRVEK